MGKSGNPAKRDVGRRSPVRVRPRRDMIEVSVDKDREIVVLNVGGELTGLTEQTVADLILSLSNARAELAMP